MHFVRNGGAFAARINSAASTRHADRHVFETSPMRTNCSGVTSTHFKIIATRSVVSRTVVDGYESPALASMRNSLFWGVGTTNGWFDLARDVMRGAVEYCTGRSHWTLRGALSPRLWSALVSSLSRVLRLACSRLVNGCGMLTPVYASDTASGEVGDDAPVVTCPTCGSQRAPASVPQPRKSTPSKVGESTKANGDYEPLTDRKVLELHVKCVGLVLTKPHREKWARTIVKQLGGLSGLATAKRSKLVALRCPGGQTIPAVVVERLSRVFRPPLGSGAVKPRKGVVKK